MLFCPKTANLTVQSLQAHENKFREAIRLHPNKFYKTYTISNQTNSKIAHHSPCNMPCNISTETANYRSGTKQPSHVEGAHFFFLLHSRASDQALSVIFFSSLAERAITAVPVTALQKEAIETSSAMPRIHQAETKQTKEDKTKSNQAKQQHNTNQTQTKAKHLSGNRAAYSCTTYN